MAAVDVVRKRCASDPWYLSQEFVRTEDPQADEPVRKFPAYGYLQCFFETTRRELLIAVKKSRQLLLTWAACVVAISKTGFEPHRQTMIQSQKEDKAKHLVHRIGFICRHFPNWLLPCEVETTASKVEFTFPNGEKSTIWCVPQGPDQVATYEPTLIILDEMALQKYAKETYYSALPVLRGGGQMIGISSPRAESFFVKFCNDIPAVKTLRAHYTDHPGYAAEARELGGWKKWRKVKMKEWGWADPNMWDREMEINEDISAGTPAFRPPFNPEIHIADREMLPNPALPIQRGWDFGYHHPACVWTQVAVNGQWLILREQLGSDIPLTDFIQEVLQVSKELVPYPTEDSFQDYCDPDGFSKTKAHTGPSCVDLLYERGIYPYNDSKKVPLIPSVHLIRKNLRMIRTQSNGKSELRPGTLVDPRCKLVIQGLNGGYADPASSDKKEPAFRGGRTQDIIDALRYVAVGTFELGRVEPRQASKIWVA